MSRPINTTYMSHSSKRRLSNCIMPIPVRATKTEDVKNFLHKDTRHEALSRVIKAPPSCEAGLGIPVKGFRPIYRRDLPIKNPDPSPPTQERISSRRLTPSPQSKGSIHKGLPKITNRKLAAYFRDIRKPYSRQNPSPRKGDLQFGGSKVLWHQDSTLCRISTDDVSIQKIRSTSVLRAAKKLGINPEHSISKFNISKPNIHNSSLGLSKLNQTITKKMVASTNGKIRSHLDFKHFFTNHR
jgi:hypothetical protein